MWPTIANIIQRVFRLSTGAEIDTPRFSSTTNANTSAAGTYIYCIKPLGGDVEITSAKDINGVAISALAGITIIQGDEYKEPLTEITFASTTVVRLYERFTKETYSGGN